MIVGRTWKAKTKPSAAVPLASPAFTGSWPPPWMPSAPNTNSEPTYERFSRRVIRAPTQEKSVLPDRDLQDEEGERELEAEAPEDGPEPDGLAVRGQGPGDPQEHEQAEEGESRSMRGASGETG